MEEKREKKGSLGMAMSIVFFYTINPSSFIRKPCMARELLNISPSLHPDSQRAKKSQETGSRKRGGQKGHKGCLLYTSDAADE